MTMRRAAILVALVPTLMCAASAVYCVLKLPPSRPPVSASTLAGAYGAAVANAMSDLSRSMSIIGIIGGIVSTIVTGAGALSLRSKGRGGPWFVLVLSVLWLAALVLLLIGDSSDRKPEVGPLVFLGVITACEAAAALIGFRARRAPVPP
jgi:hypothetical protein